MKIIKDYIISKDDLDRIQCYLAEIEIKANELADKYEKPDNDDFDRFFDTLKTAGMFGEETEAESEKIYYDDPELVKVDESQCIVDKYEVMTCEKEDSLGTNTTLKELMDLGGNRIDIYKNDKYFGCCYKACDGNYCFDLQCKNGEFEGKADNKKVYQGLIKKVEVDNGSYDDDYGCPIVNCYLD